MRGVVLPSGRKVILSDTVGFISDLPTQLVAAFRATLEEVLAADVILHVRDISHAETAAQAADVEAILAELGVSKEVPLFEVWNKTDLLPGEARAAVLTEAARKDHVVAISALTGEGVDALLDRVSGALEEEKVERAFTLGFGEGRKRAWLHAEGVVVAEAQGEDGFDLTVRWTPRQEKRFREL
jgi:GTP-binding protein HflX